ncbi:hypothetical protein GQ607_009889 [Colletotrichum asianum]|uniref:Uncharacterized protein n=1 Tax=Colletotrichum asianum TaxID=702518 RepID=A0A8H3W7S0_9PEZI|nr:hypothetical protein GQ607_009889 [Colletotrichum asianum]
MFGLISRRHCLSVFSFSNISPALPA